MFPFHSNTQCNITYIQYCLWTVEKPRLILHGENFDLHTPVRHTYTHCFQMYTIHVPIYCSLCHCVCHCVCGIISSAFRICIVIIILRLNSTHTRKLNVVRAHRVLFRAKAFICKIWSGRLSIFKAFSTSFIRNVIALSRSSWNNVYA